MSELGFINMFLTLKKPKNALDIGIGNGRILSNYLQNTRNCLIFGIDIAAEMVNICKKRFLNNPSIVKLATCNFSKEAAPFNQTFDFITSIRVIKYNKNWPEMIKRISNSLNRGGIAVFDMPNKYSLNVFGRYSIPFYRTSKKELEAICKNNGLEILNIQSFTRIPDVFYMLSNDSMYSRLIIYIEKLLGYILGNTLLGRIIFIAVKKK